MILYADDIVFLCNDINKLAEIVKIYDATFTRFSLKISTGKTETMAYKGIWGLRSILRLKRFKTTDCYLSASFYGIQLSFCNAKWHLIEVGKVSRK